MKLRRNPIPLSLLIACFVPISFARTDTLEHVADLAEGRPGRYDDATELLSSTSTIVALASKATVVAKDGAEKTKVSSNTKPIDGKDGRPHEGPFVETAAQRDRKKAKESGDDEELPTTGKKPGPKDAGDTDGRSGPLPESNDGVMDDPARQGPKEGTTGTEGGISEKSRQRQGSLGGEAPEKIPEEPKEVPPLPHSEEKKLSPSDAKDSKAKSTIEMTKGKDGDENAEKKSTAELGGLTVRQQMDIDSIEADESRNPKTFPRSPTTYLTRLQTAVARKILWK